MSYVKISDPAIIDLAGIQQIISVVNQHSDLLNVLVNRFGTVITPEWNSENTQGIYDPSTHNLAFGKATLDAVPENTGTTDAGKTYYKDFFVFGSGVTFSSKPLVVVSLDNSFGSESGQLDVMVSVHDTTTTGFTIRAARSGFYNNKQTIDNKIQVNWIAIGPR
jgi:hypothetical protein